MNSTRDEASGASIWPLQSPCLLVSVLCGRMPRYAATAIAVAFYAQCLHWKIKQIRHLFAARPFRHRSFWLWIRKQLGLDSDVTAGFSVHARQRSKRVGYLVSVSSPVSHCDIPVKVVCRCGVIGYC